LLCNSDSHFSLFAAWIECPGRDWGGKGRKDGILEMWGKGGERPLKARDCTPASENTLPLIPGPCIEDVYQEVSPGDNGDLEAQVSTIPSLSFYKYFS